MTVKYENNVTCKLAVGSWKQLEKLSYGNKNICVSLVFMHVHLQDTCDLCIRCVWRNDSSCLVCGPEKCLFEELCGRLP